MAAIVHGFELDEELSADASRWMSSVDRGGPNENPSAEEFVIRAVAENPSAEVREARAVYRVRVRRDLDRRPSLAAN